MAHDHLKMNLRLRKSEITAEEYDFGVGLYRRMQGILKKLKETGQNLNLKPKQEKSDVFITTTDNELCRLNTNSKNDRRMTHDDMRNQEDSNAQLLPPPPLLYSDKKAKRNSIRLYDDFSSSKTHHPPKDYIESMETLKSRNNSVKSMQFSSSLNNGQLFKKAVIANSELNMLTGPDENWLEDDMSVLGDQALKKNKKRKLLSKRKASDAGEEKLKTEAHNLHQTYGKKQKTALNERKNPTTTTTSLPCDVSPISEGQPEDRIESGTLLLLSSSHLEPEPDLNAATPPPLLPRTPLLSSSSSGSSLSSASIQTSLAYGKSICVTVDVNGKSFRVPVPSSGNRTIAWMCNEVANRYEASMGLKPRLQLTTADGAEFHPDDPVQSMLINNNEVLVGVVLNWDLALLTERYKRAAAAATTTHLGQLLKPILVCKTTLNLLAQCEKTHKLAMPMGLSPGRLEPVIKALNHQNDLRELELAQCRLLLSSSSSSSLSCSSSSSSRCAPLSFMTKLCTVLPSLKSLVVLDLSSCGISKSELELLSTSDAFKAGGGSKSSPEIKLKKLNLSFNLLGDQCSQTIALLVGAMHGSLETLRLDGCLFSEAFWSSPRLTDWKSALRSATSLIELSFAHNNFAPKNEDFVRANSNPECKTFF